MNVTNLDPELYSLMLRGGAARLNAQRREINDLNVFPIPDGDTGDNMYMTISAGVSAAKGRTLSECAKSASGGMLLGARGNSGVILSRIFAGIARGLEGLSTAGTQDWKGAMRCAVEEAYGAVSQPVEGTVLTVLREGADAAAGDSFPAYFESLLDAMSSSLERTPELLPVLKEAGVVDSGGAGLLCIFRGMADALSGKAADSSEPSVASPAASAPDLDSFGPDSVLEFGYCTEFLLRLQNSKVDPDTFDVSQIRDWLCSVGESVVCFKEGTVVKVHVHTRTPGDILSHCQRWGEFLTVKVENMTLQHNEAPSDSAAGSAGRRNPVRRKTAVVTVASGRGLVELMREAGADRVIEGGQTMNPSVESFLEAFREVNADTIYVLPNNSNILLTAMQAAALFEGSDVRVMNTRNLGAGIVLLSSTDFGSLRPEDLPELDALADSVVCAMVSRAIRDTAQARSGDYIGFRDSGILCSGNSAEEAARALMEKLDCGSFDVAMLIPGAGASEDEAQMLASEFRSRWPRTEFIVRDGGQPVYDYLIILQ